MGLEGLLTKPVVELARELVGWTLAYGDGEGVIVETEAYHQCEPACHAYVGRTERTATLFAAPGIAYVYRSYGVHALLNVVAEPEGVGAAALIRALEPLTGLAAMSRRRAQADPEALASGPGKLTQALGIGLVHNGSSLLGDGPIQLLAPGEGVATRETVVAPRVGITRGVELPWRFCAAGSRYVSRPWPAGLGAQRAARRPVSARAGSTVAGARSAAGAGAA